MTYNLMIPVLALIGGTLAGWAHFGLLAVVTQMFLRGSLWAVALQSARLIVLAALLILAARFGPFTLIAASGGVMIGRFVALKRAS